MDVSINPKSLTTISTGSCTISGSSQSELVRFYEGTKFIVESYLNTPITILTDVGIKARSNQKKIVITVEEL